MKEFIDTNTRSLRRSVSNVEMLSRQFAGSNQYALKSVSQRGDNNLDLKHLEIADHAVNNSDRLTILDSDFVLTNAKSKRKQQGERHLEKQCQRPGQLNASLVITSKQEKLLDQHHVKLAANNAKPKVLIVTITSRLKFAGYAALVISGGIKLNPSALQFVSNRKYTGKKAELIK